MIERIEIPLPSLPAELEGLSVLQLSDFHVRRRRPESRALRRLLAELPGVEPDLVVLTGDYVDHPGDEEAGIAVLGALAEAWRPRAGAFGVFGNHDSAAFQEMAASVGGSAGSIRWLVNSHADVRVNGVTLRVLGVSEPEDLLAAALGANGDAREPGEPAAGSVAFRLLISHFPTQIYTAARLGIPLTLAGHTHGGQVRLGSRRIPHTSCDLTSDAATGLLRLGDSLCAISRGLGSTVIRVRLRCPPHAPLYVLRRGPLPGDDGAPGLHQALAW